MEALSLVSEQVQNKGEENLFFFLAKGLVQFTDGIHSGRNVQFSSQFISSTQPSLNRSSVKASIFRFHVSHVSRKVPCGWLQLRSSSKTCSSQ